MPGMLEIDPEKCTGCGECIEKCPTHAVELIDGKPVIAHPDACDYCTECETFCSVGAIKCPYEIVLVEERRDTAKTD